MQRAITVLLQAITGPYEAAMGRASAKTAGLAASANTAGAATGGLGSKMGGLSTKLLAGGGLVYGLTQGMQLLSEYEDALVGVGKTTGLTGDDLSRLGDDLTDLAGRIEGSAESMLRIGQTAAQLGVATDDIAEFTEVVAGIASATDLTVDAAATDMARLMNIMNLPTSNIEQLGSTIVALGNNMATTEPEILSMAQRIAGAGDLAGMAASEVLALAAAASSVGLEAEAGGTAIARVIREIETSTQTGGETLETFAALAGQSAQEFAAAWSNDPVQAFQTFIVGLSQVRDEGGNVAEIFDTLGLDGIRVSDALLRLSGNAEGVADAVELANGAFRDNIALAEEVEAANSRLSVATENLWDELKRQAREFLGNEEGARAMADGVNFLSRNLDFLLEPLQNVFSPFQSFDDAVTEAGESSELTGEQQVILGDAIRGTGRYAADASQEHGGLADEQWDAAAAAEAQYAANVALADQLRAQTDPIFALSQAVDAVTEAQGAYDDAVEESGASSEDAADASWDLYEALIGLTDASLRAGGGFETAVTQVWAMYEAGRITREQAGQLVGMLNDLQGAANDLTGDYRMQILLDMPPADRALLGRMWSMQNSGGATYTYTPDPVIPREARAKGGPVSPGVPYLVGEEGPELVVPTSAGRVVPAGETARMMGGGQQVTYDQRSYTAQVVDREPDDAVMTLRKMSLRYS